MNTQKALEYLKAKAQSTNRRPLNVAGNKALLLFCQELYNYSFETQLSLDSPNKPISSIREALHHSYTTKEIKKDIRKYVVDTLMKTNQFDIDYYVSEINRYLNKKELSRKDRYEVTHLCWCLYMICKDNNILSIGNFKDILTKALYKIYTLTPNLDEGTESIYFLTLINPSFIKKDWINNLSKIQDKEGCLPGEYIEERIHHTCLALLTYHNYKDKKRHLL